MPELPCLRVAEAVALYRSRQLSPKELVAATLSNIDRQNATYNAYRTVDHERALQSAAESERRWNGGRPLSDVDGIPFGVKDLILASGQATLFGSRARVPDPDTSIDAPSVARLREAGAVFLGKTTTSEFGWKGTADNPVTGITRNARDPRFTSGGSSGGAAVAAATGMGMFQLGTDGGGSVRIPASFNGVVGVKATFGRVPAWPPGPMMTLSNVGVLTPTVADAAAMLDIVTRPDPRDWHALPPSELRFVEGLEGSIRQRKFGLCLGADHGAVDRQVGAALRRLASLVEAAGGIVEEFAMPDGGLHETFLAHWHAGAQHLVGQIPEERRDLLDRGLAAAAERGRALTLGQHYAATVARQRFGERLQQIALAYDALILPTVPILPFEAGREWPKEMSCESWLDWATFVYPFNLSRQPAVSLPVGYADNGLPIGAQIVGPLYADRNVVSVAYAFEQMLATPIDAGAPGTTRPVESA